MANIKFSAFTSGATTANTRIVGYDSTGNTNNQYDASQLANFILDGTLSASRTLTMNNFNLTFASTTKGQEVKFGQNVEVEGQGFTTLHTGATIDSIDWDLGNVQSVTLVNGATDFDPTEDEVGATYILLIKQPADAQTAGAGTITWDGGSGIVKWPGGVAPTLTATNNAVDVITLVTYATNSYYGSSVLDLR